MLNDPVIEKIKEKIFSILTLIVTLALILLVMELTSRAYIYITKGPAGIRRDVMPDNEFGWVLNVNQKRIIRENRCGEKVIREKTGHKVIVKFPQYSAKKKILFLGDSFTHAHEVSTGKAYYDVFEEKVQGQFSVYAAGVGGFGNLQEFMILQSIYQAVQPDIVVWQLSGNDVSDNVYRLDNASWYNNQRPRPYLDLHSEEIVIKNPGFWFFDWILGFRFVYQRLLILDTKYKLGINSFLNSFIALSPVEKEKNTKYGLKVLEKVLMMAIEEYPSTEFYGFAVDNIFEDEYKNIFWKAGANYIPKLYDQVDEVEGSNCAPHDSHWNHKGNRVAGDLLSHFFSTKMGTELFFMQNGQYSVFPDT